MATCFILGGTGFLGYHTSRLLINRGYNVHSVSLNALPASSDLKIKLTIGNMFEMPDEEIVKMLTGTDYFVYAAGADERVTPKAPASTFFYQQNVLPTQRMAKLAAKAGVKKFVLYSSYFLEFVPVWTDLALQKEAYPRTRQLQEELAILEGQAGGMDVCSIRIPYVFGVTPGMPPLWRMYWDQVQAPVIHAPMGETAAVTVQQIAEATLGALEHGEHNGRYAVCGENITLQEFYRIYADTIGRKDVPVVPLPLEHLKPAYQRIDEACEKAGTEHGIHMVKCASIQSRSAALPPMVNADVLRYQPEDIRASIRTTIEEVMRVMQASEHK